MSKDPFDIFKEELQEYQPSEVPTWLSWEENAEVIRAALILEKKKKRKPFWLFLCFLLMGFVGIGSAYLLTSNNFSQKSQISSKAPDQSSSLAESSVSNPSTDKPSKEKIEEGRPLFTASSLSSNHEDLSLLPINRVAENSLPAPFISTMVTFETTPPLQPIYVKAPLLLIPDATIIPSEPTYTPEDFSPTSNWSVSLSGGINIFNPSYASSPGGPGQASFEEELIGGSASLRVNRKLGSGISLSSGIELDRLRFVFKVDETYQVNLFRPNTPDTLFINRTRRDTSIIFTDTIPGTRSILARQYSSHIRMAIPLLLGYQIETLKWTHTLRAGPQFQLYRNSNGYTIVGEGSLLTIGEKKAEDFGINLGIQAEYESAYEIASDWMILTQVGMQKSLGEWKYQSVPTITQRPLLFYGRIGIGKRF